MRFSEFAFDVVTDPAELEAARQERARRAATPPAPLADAAPAPAEGTDTPPVRS